jgi:hypothetical protein
MPPKEFPGLNYCSWLSLEQLCEALPILTGVTVFAFFQEAGRVLNEPVTPVSRTKGSVFDSLVGPLGASQAFSAAASSEQASEGILTLNTADYSSPVGLVFYVGRLSENSFGTRAFVGSRRAKVLGRSWRDTAGFWQRWMQGPVPIPARQGKPDAIAAKYKGRDLTKSDQFNFQQEMREGVTSYHMQAMLLGKGIRQKEKTVIEKVYDDLINDTKSPLQWM